MPMITKWRAAAFIQPLQIWLRKLLAYTYLFMTALKYNAMLCADFSPQKNKKKERRDTPKSWGRGQFGKSAPKGNLLKGRERKKHSSVQITSSPCLCCLKQCVVTICKNWECNQGPFQCQKERNASQSHITEHQN